ncbi:hypothetical protein AUEXF2481DRAFT_4646 [Aureobasidium subglaciale EXF-2481]|uniref:Uncharacterized protein n=1 Tax=Aureobasidium subglaciale (strain EXF-2481) TaxID=1043005 RepID=A0A074YD84_AURSE|nr:uncharacterized protein AUEXF2481DRAFT_4646 [Aureobasidium subglaciale EXF-2481]KEQ95680.1 hypothetical protein AUEXF2481DRAFT_4646 [Aureobasidium subglaciale EXF-2481]
MAQEFPIIFTLGNSSSRHEVMLINAGLGIKNLSDRIQKLATSSVNCAEALAKYKKQSGAEKVTEIKVRWSADGRDSKTFPKTTVLTGENCKAVLSLISLHGGKDILEVALESPPAPAEESKDSKEPKQSQESKDLPDRTN